MTKNEIGLQTALIPGFHDFSDGMIDHTFREQTMRNYRHWLFLKESILPRIDQFKGHFIIFNGIRKTYVNRKDLAQIKNILSQKDNPQEYTMIRVDENAQVWVPLGTVEKYAQYERYMNED